MIRLAILNFGQRRSSNEDSRDGHRLNVASRIYGKHYEQGYRGKFLFIPRARHKLHFLSAEPRNAIFDERARDLLGRDNGGRSGFSVKIKEQKWGEGKGRGEGGEKKERKQGRKVEKSELTRAGGEGKGGRGGKSGRSLV